MNQGGKRAVENQLLAMGLPALDDPALFQVMADMVNLYPIPSERVDFFCDLLNECEGARRYECYNALRPLLHFEVPSLLECESRITAKAERMVGRERLARAKAGEPEAKILHLECHGCKKVGVFPELTIAGCMAQAHKEGWGRGPIPGKEFCAECRLAAFNGSRGGAGLTRRQNALETN